MEEDVLGPGAIFGFLAGGFSDLMVGGFIYFLVFPGIVQPGGTGVFPPPPFPPFPTWVDFTPALLALAPFGLVIGALLGVTFSYFHRPHGGPVPLRRGFKYGVALSLPYLWLGLFLAGYLNLAYLATYYAAALALPTLWYGSSLVWMWNWNWSL